ncbi:pyruvate oxidase [Gracilibacillus halophilus YIM-C55.5]|uniref:Pyruvate oxidase n=1 Tax=Gracilibacillus halophilus YIM-C55.5 TaxID=1308866 RepID=N4WKT5_9BACI|nr:pyruvate oxidase [Gracilibacillus halophilus]ENH96782.1 pyruvate oxidase [Gracilibacillus halophilus YIM-C55.5]
MFEKRTGNILVDQLVEAGVDHIYGMPGNSINQFIEDLRRKEDEMDFIQVRHEEIGALAASSYAKLTGKLGVCLSIAGPGATHLINGLYDAKKDFAPVLAIVGQVPSTEVGTDSHQEINLERMFDGVAVFNKRAESAEQLPDMLHMAIREAYIYKGVSVLIVPDDLFTVKQDREVMTTSKTIAEPVITPNQETIDQAAQLLNQAEKPVILAGKGARHARTELIEFAEKLQAPVVLSLLGKGTIPDYHELNLGQHGQIGTKPAFEAVMETDLLIIIGTTFPYRDYLPDHVHAIQIEIKQDHLGKFYPITAGLCGDSKEVLPILTKAVKSGRSDAFLNQYKEKMKQWHIHAQEIKQDDSDPIHGPQIMYALEKCVEKDAIISCDVGNVTVWTSRFFPFTNQHFIISGGLASMGSGLPGAIAAQKAYPDRQVVGICGDGGFTMVMQDFITAVKYQMPVKMVVLNNSMIGMIKYEQQTKGNLNYETELEGIDFAEFARACGGEGFRIEKYSEMEDKMKQAFLSDQPAVIDVVMEDMAPLPGKITYDQAVKYGEYLIKEFFSNGNIEFPDVGKTMKRLF